MSFLDAYRGYHQKPLFVLDQEKTAFITLRGTYYYKVMPFGLKNAGATYQRLVTKMFQAQLRKIVEVYIDNTVVKSRELQDHLADLRQIFGILRQFQLKLNESKCAFAVGSGKFLGSLVTRRGIKANPNQITAIQELQSPTSAKQVQRLTGMAAALNRFISRASDKCRPFFQLLHKGSKFQWTPDCDQALQQLKRYLSSPPLLLTTTHGEALYLYLAVSDHTVSSMLIREEDSQQKPIYYTSKILLDAETRTAIKAQVLADFIVEFTSQSSAPSLLDTELGDNKDTETEQEQSWKVFVDGSSMSNRAGAGIVLQSPEGLVIEQALTFGFKASNNEAEYEALIAGLNSAKILEARLIVVFSDSQLVANELSRDYQARDDRMAAYLAHTKELLSQFEKAEIRQVGRESNSYADALANLASAVEAGNRKTVEVETLREPSIEL
ncbi:hypothetical protein AAC387_Pa10g1395 [Persea americana]